MDTHSILLQIRRCKNFENQFTFDEVITKRLRGCFLWLTVCNRLDFEGDLHPDIHHHQFTTSTTSIWMAFFRLNSSKREPLVINGMGLFTFRVRHSRGEMYIGHGRVCVCLSLATFPHYCMDLDVTWGNGRGVPASCALMGGFAIGVRFRCYDKIAPNAKCQWVLVLALCLVTGSMTFLQYHKILCHLSPTFSSRTRGEEENQRRTSYPRFTWRMSLKMEADR